MTTDSETGPIVRSWLESTTDSPYTTRLTVGRVMARLPGARRSWRGWRLPGRILPIHQESGVTVLLSGLERVPAGDAPVPGRRDVRRAWVDVLSAVSVMAVASLFVGSLLVVVFLQSTRLGVGTTDGLESGSPSPSFTWRSAPLPAPDMYLDLLGGRFVAIDEDGGYRLSGDGLAWSAVQTDGHPVAAWRHQMILATEGRSPTVTVRRQGGTTTQHQFALPGSTILTAAASGPAGIVLVFCDTECLTSTVWHSVDGATWQMVSLRAGELWDGLISTDDGFVAALDNGGYFTTVYSTDGVGWQPVSSSSVARYGIIGATPWGAVVRDMERSPATPFAPSASSAVRTTSATMASGLELVGPTPAARRGELRDLMMPPHIATMFDQGRAWHVGAGPSGFIALDPGERRSLLYTPNGSDWVVEGLPDTIPSVDPNLPRGGGWPEVLVGDDVVMLGIWSCADATGATVVCDDDPADVRVDWFRGTPGTR